MAAPAAPPAKTVEERLTSIEAELKASLDISKLLVMLYEVSSVKQSRSASNANANFATIARAINPQSSTSGKLKRALIEEVEDDSSSEQEACESCLCLHKKVKAVFISLAER